MILDFNIQLISNYSRIIYIYIYKATTRTRTRGQKGKQRRKTNPLYYIPFNNQNGVQCFHGGATSS
jgi:hypothetical protein